MYLDYPDHQIWRLQLDDQSNSLKLQYRSSDAEMDADHIDHEAREKIK
jgi:hypothetical protein